MSDADAQRVPDPDGYYDPTDPTDPPAGEMPDPLPGADLFDDVPPDRQRTMRIYADTWTSAVLWRLHRWGWALLRWLVRIGKSSPRLAVLPFRGFARLAAGLFIWLTLRDEYGQRLAADPQLIKQYVKVRDGRKRTATYLFVLAALGTAGGMTYLRFTGGDEDVILQGWAVLLLTLCVYLGARDWRVLADPVHLAWAAPGDTFVREAFVFAGLAKNDSEVRLRTPVRTDGDGWRVRVQLRRGRTFAEVVQEQGNLASALGTSVKRLWLRGVPGDDSLVDLHVSNNDPFSDEDTRNPLAESPRRTNSWDPVQLGRDIRATIVTIVLAGLSMLIGGMPRLGKTTAANNVIIHFLLDPRSPLFLADGKGLDSAPYEDLCEEVGDPANPTTMVMTLERAMEETARRQALLRENGLVKLTRDDAERLGLGLGLVWIDELTTFTQHPDLTLRRRMLGLIGDLVRIGPTVGMFAMMAAHKPSNTVIPKDITDLMPIRWALYCSGWRMSDAVLGDGQAKLGLNAARLPMTAGATILVAGSGHDAKMRPHNVRPEDMRRVADEARRLRTAAGTLPRRLAAVAGRPPILLAMHAAMTAGDGVAALPTATVLQVLAEVDAVAYGGWTSDKLAAELAQYKFGPRQLGRHSPIVAGRPTNWRGYFLEDVDKALREWRG
jgi:hypothetical protein